MYFKDSLEYNDDSDIFVDVKEALQNIIDCVGQTNDVNEVSITLGDLNVTECVENNCSVSKPKRRRISLDDIQDELNKELTDSEDEEFLTKKSTKSFSKALLTDSEDEEDVPKNKSSQFLNDDLYDQELSDSENEKEDFSKKKSSRMRLFNDHDDNSESENDTGKNNESDSSLPTESTPFNKKTKAKPKRRTLKDTKALEENLTSIYSESQRILREKRISLPYHNPPKIKSLQEFLKRKCVEKDDVENLPPALKKNMKKEPEPKKLAFTDHTDHNGDTEQTPQTEMELEDLPSFEDLCAPKPLEDVPTQPKKNRLSLLKDKLSQLKDFSPKIQGTPNSFIDLDSDVSRHKVEEFLDRFAKHSSLAKRDVEQEVVLHVVTKDNENSDKATLKENEIKVKVRPLCSNEILIPQDKIEKISSLKEKLWNKISEKKRLTREEKQEAFDIDNEEGFEDEEEEFDSAVNSEDELEEENNELEEPKEPELANVEPQKTEVLNNSVQSNVALGKEPNMDSSSEMDGTLIPGHQPGGGHKYGLNEKGDVDKISPPQVDTKNRPSWLSQSRVIPNQTQPSYEDLKHLRLETSAISEELESETNEEGKSVKNNLYTQNKNGSGGEINELLDLCSGKFETQTNTKKGHLPHVTQNDANTQELLGLCTGKFDDAMDASVGFCKSNPKTYSSKDEPPKIGNLFTQNVSGTQELLGLCTGKFEDTQNDSEDELEIDSKTKKKVVAIIESDNEDDGQVMEDVDSDDDNSDAASIWSNDFTKTSRAERRNAMFIDDEAGSDGDDNEEEEDQDDEEEEEEVQGDDEEEVQDEGYEDQDEETLPVKRIATEKVAMNDFFDEEAELSGSDIGSGDEDENEEGEECKDLLNDQLSDDEEELRKKIEKEHLKWMIDDDKREVRFFKNAFLEDGDLHTDGEGRTRKFRWRNLSLEDDEDGQRQSGDEADGGMNEVDDENWRKERHEREKWKSEQQALNESPVGPKMKKKFRISSGINRSLIKMDELQDTPTDMKESSFLFKNVQYLNSLSDKFTKQDKDTVGRRATKNFVFLSTATDPAPKRPAEEEVQKTVKKKPKFNIRQNATSGAKIKIKKSVFDLFFSKQTNSISKFSPNGQFLANTITNRVIIRNVETLQIEETFVCLDVIEAIQWSSDSKYILCAMYKRRFVQAFSLEDVEWTCKIDEGSLGIINAQWSPDGRHILTTTKFHLRVTIWSLLSRSVSYMKYAKAANPGLSFSPDGKYLALAERRDCKDHVSIFVCSTWQLVKHFEPETKDMGGILWSPSNDVLCIWDPIPENYNACLYSLDGNCLASYCAYQWALGIKTISWSPTSQFLAIGSYDEKVRLLNHITWKPIAEYGHPSEIISEDVTVYKEVEINSFGSNNDGSFDFNNFASEDSILKSNVTYEIFNNRPVILNTLTIDSNKANPKMGVGTLLFSSNARYIATVNDNMPNVIWIWDIDKLETTNILIQRHPIKSLAWSPSESVLALCTGNSQIYLWSIDKCITQEIPTECPFQVNKLLWHPRGQSLLLMSKDSMCLAMC